MARSSQNQIHDQAKLLPTKDTLTALKSDVTLESAFLELCDNALDAWKRRNERDNEATIEIIVSEKEDRTELVIRDDAGGVPREDAAMLFGLGKTAKDEISGSIGTYGVGAKKSLVNLGVPFRVRSRTPEEESGWTYRITESWFDDDEDWSVPIYDAEDIGPGITEIHIEDLNYEWNDETEEGLRQQLGEAYNLFLSDEMQSLTGNEYDLTIEVNGEPVEPEGIPDWSYPQFDGLHPRRYENIEIEPENVESSVTLNITAGLLTKKDSQEAGTDIYCQKRKVASGLRDDVGGFGTGQNRLGNFGPRHERLKVIVELETDGDGRKLPWDTQKSSIDPHNPIMRGTNDERGVYNWLRRTVSSYFELDADKVPRAFLEPYGSDHPTAVNGGVPDVLDYSERQRVIASHRPDTDLPEVSSIRQAAEAHSLFKIKCPTAFEDWERPAYRKQLKREADELSDLKKVQSPPPEEYYEDAHNVVGLINELARIHIENGIKYTAELPSWQRPRYEEYIKSQGGSSLNDTENPPSGIPATIDDIEEENYDSERAGDSGAGVYSEQTVAEEKSEGESAELFLVFGRNSDDERTAKLLEESRHELCDQFDIPKEAADEVVWEEIKHAIESSQ